MSQIKGEFHRGTFKVVRLSDKWDYHRRFGTIEQAFSFVRSASDYLTDDFVIARGEAAVRLIYRGIMHKVVQA